MKTLSVVLLALLLVGCTQQRQHKYSVQTIDTPQDDGSIWHDFIRVDVTDGTSCSLNGTAIVNQKVIKPCPEVKQ